MNDCVYGEQRRKNNMEIAITFKTYQIFFAIIIAAVIIGGFVYFSAIQITGQVPVNQKNQTDSFTGKKLVTKIIDGDTAIIEGESVRLLGMDADEKTYPCYDAAKNRLEELILNKEVTLERDAADKDQYGRYLRYIFLDDENIDLQMVREGLAVARFSPENTKYKQEIIAAEQEARQARAGCKWSGISSEITEQTTSGWVKFPDDSGMPIVGACNAGNYMGQDVIVEGYIVDVYKSRTNTVFMNFEKVFPNQCFSAVIFSSDLYKFPDDIERYYERKTVRVSGTIQEYEGKPEIILKDTSQIEVGK